MSIIQEIVSDRGNEFVNQICYSVKVTMERGFLEKQDQGAGTNGSGRSLQKEVSQPAEMDLTTAQAILSRIVNIHENTINETTPLDRVSGDSTEQVRQAIAVVSLSIMDKYGKELPGFMRPGIGDTTQWDADKQTPQGALGLFRTRYQVNLFLTKSNRQLSYVFALEEPDIRWKREKLGFTDSDAPEGKQQVLVGFLGRSGQLEIEGVRHLYRGLRWMCTNLLGWDEPTVVMPEQLDNPQLPPAQSINPPQEY